MDRAALGLGVLVLAAFVVLLGPVAFKVADRWDVTLTWAAMLLGFGTVITLGIVWAWAYRHRPVVDAETVKTMGQVITAQLKLQEEERRRRLLTAETPPLTMTMPQYYDATVLAEED